MTMKTWTVILGRKSGAGICITYFQTEDHKAKVSLSRNLKIRIASNSGLQQLCHLDPLKKVETYIVSPKIKLVYLFINNLNQEY